MKQVITSTVVLIICILTLISSFLLAENLNHNYWWQVIGMAIVTFAVGQYFLKIIKSYQATKK
ncbi:hypothetical protein NX781_01180 [Lactobacillus kullabergensis]|uniref:hypothetical protein n=1 Tax=Lactobacillus TaxID=1578 RepID=UPI0018DBAE00|nr:MULTISPECIES: hypothetical protein [Lactobacillus]MBI0120217.1 hypothetical protein [Lactobacillus sp. M0398]MBI0122365.1 hypothetical protein [Lactobacillus sp. W8174]MBI0134571.1 hypothetical protein [Lactobacillus sp. W8173]MCX0290427.1 hypothetical protein [Lactobacillus kullabergensis]